MRKLRRALLPFALLSLSLVGGGATTANAAITVSNPGTFTIHDAGGVELDATLYGFNVTITCSTMKLTVSTSSSGATSVSGATFVGCTDGLGSAVTVAATGLPWSVQIKGSTGAYRFDSLPIRVQVTPSFGGTCSYNGGTVTTTSVPSPVSSWTYANAGPSSSTTFGCGSGTWKGTFTMSKSLNISGSL